jgi:hypothetical protein
VIRTDVVAATGAEQADAVRVWLAAHPAGRRAILAESGLQPLDVPDDVALVRLMAGCICCVGYVPMRVALVRLLRQSRPDALLVLVADGMHLDRVRAQLSDPGFGLELTSD